MKPTARSSKRKVESPSRNSKRKVKEFAGCSTERSRKHRVELYADELKHNERKEYDRLRKRMKREEEKIDRRMNIRERVNYRMKETLRKRVYRQRKKNEKKEEEERRNNEVNIDQEFSMQSKVKSAVNAARRLRRRKDDEINKLKVKISGLLPKHNSTLNDESQEEEGDSDEQSSTDFLWHTLTPRTKGRVKHYASQEDVPKHVRKTFRDELGINLSNKPDKKCETKSKLRIEVENFFERDDVSRMCPDKNRKISVDGSQVQIRWRLGYLKTLHLKFISETDNECSYSTFVEYVPPHIKKPSSSDWGTCLCMLCLNPELKMERLFQLKLLCKAPDMGLIMSNDEYYDEMITHIKNLTQQNIQQISFTEWKKIDSEEKVTSKGSKKISKLTRKVLSTLSINKFVEKLILEMNDLKEHLKRVHVQYSAFKKAREEASLSTNSVATIQIDWSENARIRQAKEEKSAYYHEDQISLHTAYSWFGQKRQSYVCLSDCTEHRAAAVFTGIQPILEQLVNDGAKKLNIISDSPTSQYRNKDIFYLMQNFTKTTGVPLTWIYLEAGHGKGAPDGIGAVVKRAISDLIPFNPDLPQYKCDDLIKLGLKEALPSILVSQYSFEDILRIKAQIPSLKPVYGTMKCHEVSSEISTESEEVLMSMKPLSNDAAIRFELFCLKSSLPVVVQLSNEASDENSDVDDPLNDNSSIVDSEVSDEAPPEKKKKVDDDETDVQYIANKAQESLEVDDNKGKFYCVYFDKQRYWGKLIHIFANDVDEPVDSVEMSFLHYKCNGKWDYPKCKDIQTVSPEYIFLGPVTPMPLKQSGFHFEEDAESLRLYKAIKTLKH